MAETYWTIVDKAFDRHVPRFLGKLMVGLPSAWGRSARSARSAVCATLRGRGYGIRLAIFEDGQQSGVLYDLRTGAVYPHFWWSPVVRGSQAPVHVVEACATL